MYGAANNRSAQGGKIARSAPGDTLNKQISETNETLKPVSYTHLDVYKRQA